MSQRVPASFAKYLFGFLIGTGFGACDDRQHIDSTGPGCLELKGRRISCENKITLVVITAEYRGPDNQPNAPKNECWIKAEDEPLPAPPVGFWSQVLWPQSSSQIVLKRPGSSQSVEVCALQ